MLYLVAALVARLPRGALDPLGSALGFVAGSFLRIRRRLVERAMLQAGVSRPSRTAGQVYKDLGRGLAELLWAAGASPAARADAIAGVAIDDELVAAIDRALARGPLVFFASHTGNWELVAAAAASLLRSRGRRLLVVAKRLHDPTVERFMTAVRASLGVVVVPPTGALAAVRRALAAGDVVAMPIDQVPECAEHGSLLPFLGGAAFVDRAPAIVAWRARATVLVVAGERGERHEREQALELRVRVRVRVRLLAAIPPGAAGESAGRWIGQALATATSALDAFVRRAPAAWLWLHRRWRVPASARQ